MKMISAQRKENTQINSGRIKRFQNQNRPKN